MPSLGEPAPPVADGELIVTWFREHPGYWAPGSPSTANFDLRPGEASLSVWRLSLTSEAELRARFGHGPDVVYVARTARQVRDLAGGDGTPLNLDVVPDPDHGGPAHAGVLDPDGRPGRTRGAVKKALKRLFCDPWPPAG